jgi:hypothetical protein
MERRVDPFAYVIVRLLYGLMLEEKGRSRGGDRRAAVLTALARCADHEPSLLVDLMLNSMESSSAAHQDGLFLLHQVSSNVSFKRQSGYLTLVGDVLKNLGSRSTAYWPALLGTTLDLLRGFCRVRQPMIRLRRWRTKHMKRRVQSERYSFQSFAFCEALSSSPISFTALSIRTTASGKAHQPFKKEESREPRRWVGS